MDALTYLIAFVLSVMGVTVCIVWPAEGPMNWVRERVLKRMLPEALRGVFDCYICLSVWVGLALSPLWYYMFEQSWSVMGFVIVPPIFWWILQSQEE